jgi:hypothetical protein
MGAHSASGLITWIFRILTNLPTAHKTTFSCNQIVLVLVLGLSQYFEDEDENEDE